MAAAKTYWYPLAIIGALFFIFGFLTWINGILIPFFQICLELSNLQALLVVLASYGAYFVMALPSAWVLKHTGYKKGMALGLLIMAAGTLLFIPAAYTRLYALFLTGLFITGTGLTLLQTAANPYVAIIGPAESTAQRIGIMGLCNKIAGIISTTVVGSIFLFNADEIITKLSTLNSVEKAKLLSAYSLKVVEPYLVISGILLLMSVLIMFSKLPEVEESTRVDQSLTDNDRHKESIVEYPYLILGVIALFLSSACEGIPVDGIVLYSRAMGIKVEVARHFATYTLCSMLAGYLFTVVAVPRFVTQQQALRISAVLGLLLSTMALIFGGTVSIWCIILMGFGSAMLWGTIWGLALRNLGKFTKQGSALLLMTVIGGGIFPVLYGKLLDINARTAIMILIPCYMFLLFYAAYGYRFTKWKKTHRKVAAM
jgi:MFS transporter, FHS family, L-fucose permease